MSEVHFCTLLIATTTTSINTLGCAQGEATPQQIIDVLPLEPECLNITLSMLREMDNNFPELPSVVALFNVLPGGLKSLDVYFSDCKSLGKERAAVLNKNILFDVWYSLCRSATKAISEIKSRIDGMLPNIYDQNASVLTSLLGGAQEELKTCTDPEGKFCIPVLPQKRRWPRYSLSEECVVFYNDHTASAFVKDISAGGLGLERISGVKNGQEILVKLNTGRQFSGTVAWACDSHVGIKFSKALPASDPLLHG